MNAPQVATLPLRNALRLRTTPFTLACLLVLSAGVLAGCGSPAGGAVGDHKCADKVAQATTTASAVLGLWNCLDAQLQTTLKADGATASGSTDAALSIDIATIAHFVGATSELATYDLILSPSIAQQAGTKDAVLTVWFDASGKVSNVGLASPAF